MFYNLTVLAKIAEKISSGRRVSRGDALKLFESDDLFSLGRLASLVSKKKNGRKVYFVINRHINPTNICINRCRFCAFSRSKGEEGAFALTVDEVIEKLREGQGARAVKQRKGTCVPGAFRGSSPLTEVHIVGGLHPDWPFEYYLRMVSAVRRNFPKLHIKAFTAVEIDHFSRISDLPLREVLMRLKESGLDAMPGGGAEIFDEGVRNRLCPEKISGERWLDVHAIAHSCGIRTNATMLYGHIEQYEDRVDHLFRLRALQDRTGGFQAFIPLAYHPKNTEMGGFCSSGIDDLKTVAVSRIVLDNVDHIKAYWIMLGEKIAQLSLLFGADDLDGTVIEEKITHSAGALSREGMTREELVNLITKAGRRPVERDAFYNAVG